MLLILCLIAAMLVVSGERVIELFSVLLVLEVSIYMLSLAKVWFHVIMILILLEFISIKGFVIISIKAASFLNPAILFLFSVLMVCEARLGMGLIVRIRRGRGDEGVVI